MPFGIVTVSRTPIVCNSMNWTLIGLEAAFVAMGTLLVGKFNSNSDSTSPRYGMGFPTNA